VVWLRCRFGIEALLAEELGAGARPRVLEPGRVEARARGSLADLFRARLALRFSFPLPVDARRPLDEAVIGALTSDDAHDLMRALTDGTPRYRLEWASGGHRRGLTFRVAQAVAARRADLVNDPTSSAWEAVVTEGERTTVELWPRGLDDPRFTYRVEQVPASSHPTVAAALAFAGGAREDDVVWDPFVGGATELIERARLGPYRRLYGSDASAQAIEHARKNLHAAGVEAELAIADASGYAPPEAPTLVVTNPPMGRRVLDKTRTGGLLHDVLAHASRLLAPRGRIVWVSPRPVDTAAQAEREGLRVTLRRRIDMAGFWAELQRFERGPRG
jgi:23S rRNA G2445 N2-methylase RlmL